MKSLTVVLFAVVTVTVTARHRKEWQRVDPKRAAREHLHSFYKSDIPACIKGAGFYRDPHDCHQYIRCVDEFGSGRHFSVFLGRCEPGLVFDENVSACNWPDLAAPCSNSPEKLQEVQKPPLPETVAQENVIHEETNRDKPYPVQQQVIHKPQNSNSHDSQQQEVWHVQIVHPPEESDSYEQHQKEVSWQQQPVIQEIQIAAQEPIYQDEIPQQEIQNFDEKVDKQEDQQKVHQEKTQIPINQQHNFEQTQAFEKPVQEEIKPASVSFQDHQQQQISNEGSVYDSDQTRDSTQQHISPSGFQQVVDENQQFEVSANVGQEQVQQQQETQSQWWVQENGVQHNPPHAAELIPTADVDSEPIFCAQEGFFRHPENCSQFIRCVKFESGAYQIHFFECPKHLVFNEKDSACVVADIHSCRSNSRQKRQAPNSKLPCRSEGFFRHPEDCRTFYRCVKKESGSYETHLFSCPANLVFDEEYTTCNWPEKAPPCDNQGQQFQRTKKPTQTERPSYKPIRTTSKGSTSKPRNDYIDKTMTHETYGNRRSTDKPKTTARSSYERVCRSQGFFTNETDCTKFFKCVRKEYSFVRYDLACPNNFAFDEKAQRCIAQRYVTSCNKNKPPYPPRQKDEETTVSPAAPSAESSSNSHDSSNEDIVCEQEGYFRHPEDCNRFYRCVDFNGNGQEFVRYDFKCPEGLVFDETNSVCNWPDPTAPCDSRSGGGGTGQEGGNGGTGQEDGNGGAGGNETGDGDNENQGSPSSTSRKETSTEAIETTPNSSVDDSSKDQGGTGGESENGCTKEGFYRNPEDCNKFYRCVDFNGEGKEFVRYDFTCPEGLVFDEVNSVCNWPSDSEPCDSQSGGGNGGNGEGTATTDRQGESSEDNSSSNEQNTSDPNPPTEGSSTEKPSDPGAGTSQSPTGSSDGTTSDTRGSGGKGSSGECTEAGFFRNPEDCNKFYRCVDYNEDGQEFVKYDFTCPEGLVFDEANSVCNWPEQSAPCDEGRPGGESTDGGGDGSESSQTTKGSGESSQTTAGGGERSSTESTTSKDENSTKSTDSNETTGSTTERSGGTSSGGDNNESTSDPSSGGSNGRGGDCTEEGFFRNPEDCGKFYRCVDFNGDGQQFVRYDFDCPEGLVFDEVNSVCNWPEQSPACETSGGSDGRETTASGGGSSQTESSSDQTSGSTEQSTQSSSEQPTQSSTEQPTRGSTEEPTQTSTRQSTSQRPTGDNSECSESGFYRCKDDCSKFYRCVEEGGRFVRYDFKCPDGLIFDDRNKKCDWPSSELTCETDSSTSEGTSPSTSTATTSQSASTTQSSTSSSGTSTSDIECTEEGYFRNPDDCSKYYRCIDEGDGRFTREDFSCAEDEVFDEEMRYCNRKDLAPPCDRSQTTSSQSQTTSSQTQTSSESTTERTTSSQSPQSSSTSGGKSECTEPGFFRCRDDCTKFYRCVEENGNSQNLVRYDFHCPDGLIFDERNNRCDFPSSELTCESESSASTTQSPTSSSSSGTTSSSPDSTASSGTTSSAKGCTEEGFFRNPEDCSKYYRCLDEGDGTLTREDFACEEDEVFDEEMRYCNRRDLAPPCDETSSSTESSSRGSTEQSSSGPSEQEPDTTTASSGTTSGSSGSGECQEEGFHRDPNDCGKFYRCVDFQGDGQSFTRYDFDCPEGLVFDETNDVCNWPSSVPSCESSGGSGGSTEGSSSTTSGDSSSSTRDRDSTSSTTSREQATSTTSGEQTPSTSSGEQSSSSSSDGSSTSGTSTTSSSSNGDSTTSGGSTTSSGNSESTRSSSSNIECTQEGFFRHPDDCNKFYRCVDFAGTGESFVRYDFDCPEGLVFDEVNSVCNWPNQSPRCETGSRGDSGNAGSTGSTSSGATGSESTSQSTASGTTDSTATSSRGGDSTTPRDHTTTRSSSSSDTTSSTSDEFRCEEEGYFKHPSDCKKYYECKRDQDTGELVRIDCECPDGQVWDNEGWYCNDKELSPPCDENGSSFRCREEGFFRDPEDCTKYYRCNRTGPGENDFKTEHFQCEQGLVFDESGRYCNAPELSEPCDGSSSTTSGDSSTSGSGTSDSSTSGSSTSGDQGACTREGFFRNPEDCTKYYQCSRNENTGEFNRNDFTCPDGRIFDEGSNYCNEPELSDEPCDTSSNGESTASQQTTSTASSSSSSSSGGSTRGSGGDPQCTQEGFFRHPDDCNKFYRCVDFSGSGESYVRYDFDCPEGLHFDEVNSVCNWPTMSPPCESGNQSFRRYLGRVN